MLANIENRIYVIRGMRVMLDRDLAELYGVPTMRLNEAVRRNQDRFPTDFMFEIPLHEATNLISQFAISSLQHGGRRKSLFVFTEQGVAMLSGILRSPRAVAVNIQIMRTFVRLRQLMIENDELRWKIEALEKRYDGQFAVVFDALRQLMTTNGPDASEIGFRHKDNP